MFSYMLSKHRSRMLYLALWPTCCSFIVGFMLAMLMTHLIKQNAAVHSMGASEAVMLILLLSASLSTIVAWHFTLDQLCRGAGFIGWLRGVDGLDLPGSDREQIARLRMGSAWYSKPPPAKSN